MLNLRTWALLLTVLFVHSCPVIVGQKVSDAASITIEITDQTGAYIPHALVSVVKLSDADSANETAEAGEDGKASVSLQQGSYNLIVSDPGFRPSNQRIDVNNSHSRTLSFALLVYSCPPGPCVTVDEASKADSIPLAQPEVHSMVPSAPYLPFEVQGTR
jgi:Carboxypeptidase regulatory-like domain